MEELKATGYNYNAITYTSELEQILGKISICYAMMIENNVELPNDENEIRNVLLLKYLKNNDVRNNIGLLDYLFDREVPEDVTKGRTDIKIQTKNTFTTTEAYYIIECKKLDNTNLTGTSGLNAEYINNGIYRFVSKYYSAYYRVNAMIGFVVEKMDIHTNITNINALLRNSKINNCNTTQEIQRATFINNFDYHYFSEHNDIDNESFALYHLMLDFSENITKNVNG
ncbi:hypothetical protein FACS189426_11760 [Bacteroidia bacterium]|nr:hypothetical protein FACS189426_11760 [Bacteroidia bacterium]GHV70323.1 hypothetical protein FACS189420_0950 [Bacteroidia bacterium]